MIRKLVLTIFLGVSWIPAAWAQSPLAVKEIPKQSLSNLGQAVENYIKRDFALGGELLVIQNGKPVFHKSYGVSSREDKRPWKNDTICNIRSMTKPITSAAAQILIDRNQLDLDAPVAKYLPSFDNEKSKLITVRQVLTHRSGLPLSVVTVKIDQYKSLRDQAAAAGKEGPIHKPDSKFWYSDAGTDVVAAIVEKISGKKINEFVKQEILDPLSMSDTFYGIPASKERISQVASAYMKTPKGWQRFFDAKKPLYPFAWGSQTIYSTTSDYAKFLKLLMNDGRIGDRQILSQAAVKRMKSPVSRMKMLGSDSLYPTGFRGLETHYGQMLVTHRKIGNAAEKAVIIGHSGSDGTNAWGWPEKDLIIVYFTQSRGGVTPIRIEEPIDKWIIHPGKRQTVPKNLQPYTGTFIANYGNFHGEEFTVGVKNGKLVLDVPSQMLFELMPPDQDGEWAFVLAPKIMRASFKRDKKNEVIGLQLHKGRRTFEVPRKGTQRAKELTEAKGARIKRKSTDSTKGSANKKTVNQTTTWAGVLVAGKTRRQLEIVIDEVDGKLSGRLRSLSVEVGEMKLSTVQLNEKSLRFEIKKLRVIYEGKLNKSGDVVDGTFSQGTKKRPLILKKKVSEKK